MNRPVIRQPLAAIALLGLVATPAVSLAQESAFQFSPSIALMASYSNNPLQISDSNLTANFLQADLDLPFAFRGPRWDGRFSLRPGYQKSRDADRLDSFNHSADFDVRGVLGRRTSLYMEGSLVRAEDLSGQIGSDVVVPRSLTVRGGAQARLTHQVSRRDSLDVFAEYGSLRYPDSVLIGNQSFGGGVGYAHRLNERFALTATANVQLVSFEDSTRARSGAATAGFRYRMARRTEIEIESGALFVQQDVGIGFETVAGAPGITVGARLSHGGDNTLLALRAGRDMGYSNGLGHASIRDQLRLSLVTGRRGWSLEGAAAYNRNELLSHVETVGESTISSWTGCVGGGLRITRHLSAVGSFLFAHQITSNAGGVLDIDSYRAAAGLMLQANPPAQVPGASDPLERIALARTGNVTC